jgi:hypothetical protein
MQPIFKLPVASTIFEYLKVHCLTENIEIGLLKRVAEIAEDRIFDREELEKEIQTKLPIGFIKTIDIGYTLNNLAKGKPATISLTNKENKSIETKHTIKTPSTKICSIDRIDSSQIKTPLNDGLTPHSIDESTIIYGMGERVGSFKQLSEKINHQIKFNNENASHDDYRSKMLLENFSAKHYVYKNGLIYLDHDPLKKVVRIQTKDIKEKVHNKMRVLIENIGLTVETFIFSFSSREEFIKRMKKELVSHTYYSISYDSSWAISDDYSESKSDHVVKWNNIENLSLDEVRSLKWSNKFHNLEWKTIDAAKLSEPFIREFSNQVSWESIAKHQKTLSKKFKAEFNPKFN